MHKDIPSVLLIDDDDELASFVSATLVERGYSVTRLASGWNALEVIQQGTFDLLITDIVMPEKNGLELITELRKAGVDLPILAMSGAAESALYLRMARHLGAIGVLFKPFRTDELIASLQRLLKTQQAA